ncbi:MAG: A/G-specific adenine glycosylase [Woeseiaceae bacterium]|nr:A/G-specific adenine glycosylase [Woeseiaceae bacterium]
MSAEFSKRVLRWFDEHGRKHLPWQRSRDPYAIWISEIMLQQTQVQTVIPYFERFMTSFPTLNALADAELDHVLAHWSGLGYYARARNLHRAAQVVRDEHAGQFPRAFDDVEALPGIGRSTAGAILSLAHGDRFAILDGNVKRVLARHAAVPGWPGKTAVHKRLWEIADERTPVERVDAYTQAMMDLGATLCTRSSPRCGECPVRRDCLARKQDAVTDYPGRRPKKEKPLKTTTMVIAVDGGHIYMERRPPTGIWGGLWSFPEIDPDQFDDWSDSVIDGRETSREPMETVRHSFSHYDLDILPVLVHADGVSSKVADSDDKAWFALNANPPGGIAAPVSKLMRRLLER